MNKQMYRKAQPQSAAEAHTESHRIDEAERAQPSSTTGSIDAATRTPCSSASNISHHKCSISAQQLHWSPTGNVAQVDTLTHNAAALFDVVVASDCLFFRDFHADLLETLRRLLRPGGVGIFLQPPRDGTMQRFVSLCVESGYFATELREDYNPEVRQGLQRRLCFCTDALESFYGFSLQPYVLLSVLSSFFSVVHILVDAVVTLHCSAYW
jgi:SAM-dependent methyltransferase